MSELSSLEPRCVWEIFDLICSIPHISKHEAALADALYSLARKNGLDALKDEAGNLIVRRPAAPGFENAPGVILQAHMDMVPASEGEFDFINTPITPYIDGDWVRAKGTTLGSDDGIGVAHAMAVLLDKDFRCGRLTGIFTVDEEAGMSGAFKLSAEHLQEKYLLNLDGSDTGLCIGCAGGARQDFFMTGTPGEIKAGEEALKITLSGLPGGHSGTCIHRNRGNAIKFMAEFLDQCPDLHLASFHAGSASNAIPYHAEVTVVTAQAAAEVQKLADAFAVLIKKECPAAESMVFSVGKCTLPEMVFADEFSKTLLNALILAPNEVIDFDDELDIVKTSSNLAQVNTDGMQVIIKTSQRSMVDQDRDAICAALKTHFELFHAEAKMGDVYPATPPKSDSQLLKTAIECAGKLGKKATAYAVHAGLESGWFAMKNPALEIITCGPDHSAYHTPDEKMNIPSVGKFDTFLRELLIALAK